MCSQITLPYGILPFVKDTFIASTDTTRSFLILGTGQQNFNFASAKEARIDTTVFNTNTNLSQFPASNMTSNLAGGVNFYLNNSNSKITISGLSLAIQGLEFPFVLNNKLVYLFAPMSYGNSSNTSDSAAITIPKNLLPPGIDTLLLNFAKNAIPGAGNLKLELDSITIKLVLNSLLKADAYGKVTTPFESNVNVLRVSSNLKIGFRIIANVSAVIPFLGKQSFPFDATSYLTNLLPSTIPTNVINHFFYTNTVNQPIANATINPTDTTKYANVSYRKKTINGGGSRMLINTLADQNKIKCYLSDRQSINVFIEGYKNGYEYQLYNIDGKLVKSEPLFQQESEIDIQNFQNQFLILKVLNEHTGDYFIHKLLSVN
jgi:hypothetical protein